MRRAIVQAAACGMEQVKRGVQVAAIVERIPLALKSAPAWKQEYEEFAEPIREQHRQKVNHELFSNDQTDPNASNSSSEATAAAFEPAPIATANDGLDGVHALYRRLDEIVLLLLRDSIHGNWHFPAVTVAHDETVRTAAERAIHESFNAGESAEYDMETYTLGNAPACHLPPADSAMSEQEPTFYVRMTHVEGDPEYLGDKRAWVAKDELHHFIGERENKLLQRAL